MKSAPHGIPSTLPQGAPPLRHYLQFADFTADEYAYLFSRAALIKQKFKTFTKHHTLVDRTLAMIFEKASTRTRVSFEAGMYQLGGSVVHLTTGDSQLGRSEPIEDSVCTTRLYPCVAPRSSAPWVPPPAPPRTCGNSSVPAWTSPG